MYCKCKEEIIDMLINAGFFLPELKHLNLNNNIAVPSFKSNEPEYKKSSNKKPVTAQSIIANYSLLKINIPFKGNIKDEEMTDEEFENEAEILTNDFDVDFFFLNKNNIYIAKKAVNKSKELNFNETFDPNLFILLSQSKDCTEGVNRILDNENCNKVLTNKKIMELAQELTEIQKEEKAIKILNRCCELINNKEFKNNTDLLIMFVCREFFNSEECIKYLPWVQEKINPEFLPLCKVRNVNEISKEGKKQLLKELIASKEGYFNISPEIKDIFPIIPVNKKAYCRLLSDIVHSLKINTKDLPDKNFDKILNNLGAVLFKIPDEDFKNLKITQEYAKDEFITDVLTKTKNMPKLELQKVYDYFGFELYQNEKAANGYSISGYPVNLNDEKKLSEIKNPSVIAVIEDLRKNVIQFTENNKIICSNKELEICLNDIIKYLPELRPSIGCKQHCRNIINQDGVEIKTGHQFDIFQHSLKVMQEIAKDSKYKDLTPSDKKIMLLASLLHDIAKKEGIRDSEHADNSSLDAFYITKKFNLTSQEEIKLYTLIKPSSVEQ